MCLKSDAGVSSGIGRDHDCQGEASAGGRGGRSRLSLPGGIVLSCDPVPADSQHLDEHPGAVCERAYSGTRAVRPSHGNFGHFKSESISQKQQLGIEAPALNPLTGK